MIRATVICSDQGPGPNLRAPNLRITTSIASGNSGTDPLFGAEGMRYMLRFVFGTDPVPMAKSTTPGTSWIARAKDDGTGTIAPDAWTTMQNYQLLHLTNNGRLDAGPEVAVQWATKAWAAGLETILWQPQPYRDYADLDARIAVVNAHFYRAQDLCNAVRPNGKLPVRLIPGGQVFDAIRKDPAAPATGNAYSFFNNLYGDEGFVNGMDISVRDPFHIGSSQHVSSATGLFLVSALNVCCLYGVSPHLMPRTLEPSFTPNLSPEDGTYILRKIFDVVTTMGRAGIDTSGWVRP